MVHLRFTFPQVIDPEMVLPVHYFKAAMEGNTNVGSLANRAADTCRILRSKHPDDPFVFHLSGMVSLVNGNSEAAKMFWGQALLMEPTYSDARETLEEFLGSAGTDAYLKKLTKGANFLRREHLREARRLLKAGKLGEADDFIQKACALMNPGYSMLEDYDTCRATAEMLRQAGKMDAAMCERIEDLRVLWAGVDGNAIDEAEANFAVAEDRKQFAAIAAEVLKRRKSDNVTCFELGCFTGFNLGLVRETLGATWAERVSFHGLEPNAAAVAYCRGRYPFIQIRQGTHVDLIDGGVPLPNILDACLIGRVFQMLHSDDVSVVLEFLGGRVRHLVIADDVVNVDGEFPIIRTPLYIMHNFRMPLEAAGFVVEDVVFADAPDRLCTGFIVARSEGIG